VPGDSSPIGSDRRSSLIFGGMPPPRRPVDLITHPSLGAAVVDDIAALKIPPTAPAQATRWKGGGRGDAEAAPEYIGFPVAIPRTVGSRPDPPRSGLRTEPADPKNITQGIHFSRLFEDPFPPFGASQQYCGGAYKISQPLFYIFDTESCTL